MKQTFSFFLIILLLAAINLNAQENKIYQPKPIIDIRGDETGVQSNAEIIELSGPVNFAPVQVGNLIFEVHNITNRATGYDLQSNASTQQVWVDLNNPEHLHAHFTNSQQSAGWTDRNCLYFGSANAGVDWFELGQVPTTGRAGFSVAYGNSQGSAVLLNHNNFFGGFTRTTVSIDDLPFGYDFTNYDPGDLGDGPVWPRVIVDQQDNVVFATSGAPDAILHLNTLNTSTGLFTGWQNVDGAAEVEMYDLSISDNGKIGLAFVGATPNDGDVYYQESTDGGLTWSTAEKIWDADTPAGSDSVWGHLRGISINYYGEDPCLTFELGWITTTGYYPGLPSEIRFWSQNVNGGIPLVIADSSDIPFYPNFGVDDVQFPLCRPVIGRADNDFLFVAFIGTTGEYWPGTGSGDSTAYYAGYFTYSRDGGNTWSAPERFTPDTHLRDWRYPSIAEITPKLIPDDDTYNIHIVMQGDSIPGSTVNAAGSGMPVGVTAQYYHFSTEITDTVASVEVNDFIADDFILEQNYPNPFNPRTTIKYSIPTSSFAQLKVYDVLGNEVATLVNEEKHAGTYEVNFSAEGLTSGIYFYKLSSGSFVNTKKMLLLK
jgi:hypothetical protein